MVEFAIGDKAREIATGYVVEIIDVEAETTPTKVVGYQVRFKDKSEKWVRPDELYPEKVNLPEPKAGHPEFYAILDEMKAVHERKAADYGSDEDPLHNVRSGGEFANIPAWVAAMLRANDKMVRLKSLIKKGKLENESAEDSLMDIANYAILALILKREGGR